MTQKRTVSRKNPISRTLWIFLMAAMVVAAGSQWLVPAKDTQMPAFYCLLGLGVSFVLILFTRLVGFILKRPQDYWQEDSIGGDDI